MKADQVQFAVQLLTFTGEVDSNGSQIRYQSVKREHFNARKSLLEKLRDGVEVVVKAGRGEKVVKASEWDGKDGLREQYVDLDVELTEGERNALKHYYTLREELPNMDIDLQEFEKLFNK